MAIKAYRPTTPARRGMTSQDFSMVTAKKSPKTLRQIRKAGTARNNQGRITTRHKGGGARRFHRVVNFNLPLDFEAKVEQIEYDPNRSARIALIRDKNGQLHYILAAKGLRVGSKVLAGEEIAISRGNRLPIKKIPTGTAIHAVELQPGRGAQLGRSAGASIQLVAKEKDMAQVRLPSGEIRQVSVNAMATIGIVGNDQHQNVQIGKAGRKRRMGIRPTVRGTAMNSADHPMGGGDGGRGKPGRPPVTPWGQQTLGLKTRKRKMTNKYIVRSRKQGRRK